MMMGGQLMVVLVVAIIMLGLIVLNRGGSRRRLTEQSEALMRENDRLRSEMEVLQDRVAVLERITVEKENSLERQIKELRDQ